MANGLTDGAGGHVPPEADTVLHRRTSPTKRRTRPPGADTVLRCEGSVAMVTEAGERAKGEVADGGGRGAGG